jgi:hypothetical protein
MKEQDKTEDTKHQARRTMNDERRTRNDEQGATQKKIERHFTSNCIGLHETIRVQREVEKAFMSF